MLILCIVISLQFTFQKNRGLIKLDISWNGFHISGSTTIAKALEENKYLTELDLSCNRLSETCVYQLLKGLRDNTTLTRLKVRFSKSCYI